MAKFFIIGLPRSRTAWLANFFTHGPSYCYHDPLVECESLDDLDKMEIQTDTEYVGFSDAAFSLMLDRLSVAYPFAPKIIVHRPLHIVRSSCEKVGLTPPPDGISLHAINGLHVQYQHLNEIPVLSAMWNHVIGKGFSERRARMLIDMKIESMLSETISRVNTERVRRLFGVQ